MRSWCARSSVIWFCCLLALPWIAEAKDEKPYAPSDRERAVSALLVGKLGADAATIQIAIKGDRAILSGEVEERVTQELASEVALSFEGIRSSSNRVRARKAPTLPEGHLLREGLDAELERRVEKAIRMVDPAAGKLLAVEAADGVVSVRGYLDNPAHRARALAIARAVPGVTIVVDLVQTSR